jgi:hypothetical protein
MTERKVDPYWADQLGKAQTATREQQPVNPQTGSSTLTPAQQEAVKKLVGRGGVARVRQDGQVEVRTSSFKSRCEYVVTPAGETILTNTLPQRTLWRLGRDADRGGSRNCASRCLLGHTARGLGQDGGFLAS